VIEGKKYYDPKLTKSTTTHMHADDSFMKQFQLTKREIEIIGLVGKSYTTTKSPKNCF
jgi:DNA-binding CsgD family transcriptional regulator